MQGATCMRAPWPSVGASNDSTIPARDMPVEQVAWPRQVRSNAMAAALGGCILACLGTTNRG